MSKAHEIAKNGISLVGFFKRYPDDTAAHDGLPQPICRGPDPMWPATGNPGPMSSALGNGVVYCAGVEAVLI